MLKLLIISPLLGIMSLSIFKSLKYKLISLNYLTINNSQVKLNKEDNYANPSNNILFANKANKDWKKEDIEKNKKNKNLKIINREIGVMSGIITYYISLYILLKYNNNNVEYQLRETINLNWYQLNLGVDGISLILIILTTFIFPILFLLIPIKSSNISRFNREENKISQENLNLVSILPNLPIGQVRVGINKINNSIISQSLIEVRPQLLSARRTDNIEQEKEEIKLIKIILLLEIIILIIFSTLDIFLFYLIFEILLIPFFILISQYGSKEHLINTTKSSLAYKASKERKEVNNHKGIEEKITKTSMEATKRFFFYSLFGSLFLFISIIFLFYILGSTNNEIFHYSITNLIIESKRNILLISNSNHTFGEIGITNILVNEKYLLLLLWLSIFIPFVIKIPIFPFHSWLPLAHSEANTIGSILLAAILLKIGSYGIFRYIIELFNNSYYIYEKIIINNYIFPIIITFCTLSIIFGSFSTIRQIDIKRIIAYSSIVHMNYSIISIFNLEYKSLIGGVFLILSHAFVSSGLFLLIGILYIRYSTRIYFYYQHLANFMPLFTTYFFLLILNLISIPFSSSFISEFLMLSGLLKSNLFICILLSFSLFLNTLYSIWFFNRLSFGLSPTLLILDL